MSENSFVILFVSIYVFCSLIGVSSTEFVPVYMWETTQFSEIVPALERVSQESFRNILIERAVKNTPVLLFAEQNLSPEDFALHNVEGKSPFSKLSSLKASAQISYWPFVKSPIKVIKELPDRTKVETSIKSILDNPDFTLHDNDVLVVDLNDAREGEDRLQMLKRHDKDIMSVYKRFVKDHKNIITLFTGHHSSWIISEELRTHRRVRDAGDAAPDTKTKVESKAESKAEPEEPDNHKIYETPDILIYVNSSATLHYNGTKVPLDDFIVSTKNKTDDTLVILFKSESKKDIEMFLIFKFASGYWSMTNVTVKNDTMPPNNTLSTLRVKDVYAPVGFSYHCVSQTFFNFENSDQNLTLPELQMQLYFNETDNKKFGDAYDCVGFMSAPIWSGIFVTFILVLIMTFGLTMMMDIKTMDRFDDPKGKTITISATE